MIASVQWYLVHLHYIRALLIWFNNPIVYSHYFVNIDRILGDLIDSKYLIGVLIGVINDVYYLNISTMERLPDHIYLFLCIM